MDERLVVDVLDALMKLCQYDQATNGKAFLYEQLKAADASPLLGSLQLSLESRIRDKAQELYSWFSCMDDELGDSIMEIDNQ